ncbi:MAG: S41 family peptidase [Planctomycetaceae bacterium]
MSWRHWACLLSCLVLCISLAPARGADEEDDDDDTEAVEDALTEETEATDAAPATKEEQYFELIRIFADTFEQIERNYVKEVDRRKLVEGALKGMLQELDPYSNYISPDELARFNLQVEQEFGGIGIQVTDDPQTRRLTVVSPLPGTPAYKAGVRAGDVIVEINGKSTEKMTQDDAVKMMKGKEGEEVTIGVLHQGATKIEHLTMKRARIQVATVQGDTYKSDDTWNFMLDDEKKVGYVRLVGFSRNTGRELRDALSELKSQGMRGLILDLRFNPGGLLNVATEVADLFLDDGKIVSTKGRNTEERVVYAKKPGTFSGFPMAVLINHYSASASEIVSAALQDHHRAVVIGERTWGKGSVQNVIDLENGKSALKLTTASYHRPSGKNIHRFPDSKDSDEWGVSPDEGYMIALTTDELRKHSEYRRQRDVLTGSIPPKSEYVDRQLAKAVDYINSQFALSTTPEATAKVDAEKPAPAAPNGKPPSNESPKPAPRDDDGAGNGSAGQPNQAGTGRIQRLSDRQPGSLAA